MKVMLFFLSLFLFNSCQLQSQQGQSSALADLPCENCDALYDYGDKILLPIDTLPDFATNADQLLLTGTIYQHDGRSPAKDVILFIYQTDSEGLYHTRQPDQNNRQKYIYHRGWIKTDASGHYAFYTFLPGSYPGRNEPRHIHPLIKEPNKPIYYMDEFVFDHDELLTAEERAKLEDRGGSGIMKLEKKGNLWVGKRDLILGLNVPGYE